MTAAIRAAALALGRPVGELSSSRYYAWVAAQRRWARARGMPAPRLPTQRSVERLFARGWLQVKEYARNAY